MLFVDVNLGNENHQRIVIYEGDTPEELAQEFANQNSNFLFIK